MFRTPHRAMVWWIGAGLLLTAACGAARAQTPPTKPADKPDAKPAESLALSQQRLAERYRQLENLLLRMAELSATTDPRRAALLKKAVAQSKEQLIGVQFDQVAKLIQKDQLSNAIENQTQLERDLQALLDLLSSENRSKRIESEKARIAQYLKRLNQIINQQKSLQGRTASADNATAKPLSGEQKKLADQTGGLAKDIHANEEGGDASKDAEKGKPSDGKEGGKPQGSAEGKAQPSESGKGPKDASKQENPTRKRLEAARQRMEQAQNKLDEAKRKDAVQQQEEAIRELEQAKAELEEILRQLREEEMERVLAMLEARLVRMLQMQREVLDGTIRLDKIPLADRTHSHEIEAGRVSTKEMEIVVEADKALLLLREDGTAMAFPEALAQAKQDMQQIVQRLAAAKVDKVTQAVEQDVIAALQEMIEAVKKAQKNQENRRRQSRRPSQPQDPSLVDTLSELRMIRALQMRVNNRTEQYRKLIDGEQADSAELILAIRQLAERQQKIYQITRDLGTGKNR